VRFVIQRAGYKIYRRSTPPYGISAVADIIRYSPNPLDMLVDVGANVGQTVMEFCDAAPNLRVYAYEPICLATTISPA